MTEDIKSFLLGIVDAAKLAASDGDNPDDYFIQAEGYQAAHSLPSGQQKFSNLKNIKYLNIIQSYNLMKLILPHFQDLLDKFKQTQESVIKIKSILQQSSSDTSQENDPTQIAKSILLEWKEYYELDFSITWSVHDCFNRAFKHFKQLYKSTKNSSHSNSIEFNIYKKYRKELNSLDDTLYTIFTPQYKEVRENVKRLLHSCDDLFESIYGESTDMIYNRAIFTQSTGITDYEDYSDNNNDEDENSSSYDNDSNMSIQSNHIYYDSNDDLHNNPIYHSKDHNSAVSFIYESSEGGISEELTAGSTNIRHTKKILDKYEAGDITGYKHRRQSTRKRPRQYKGRKWQQYSDGNTGSSNMSHQSGIKHKEKKVRTITDNDDVFNQDKSSNNTSTPMEIKKSKRELSNIIQRKNKDDFHRNNVSNHKIDMNDFDLLDDLFALNYDTKNDLSRDKNTYGNTGDTSILPQWHSHESIQLQTSLATSTNNQSKMTKKASVSSISSHAYKVRHLIYDDDDIEKSWYNYDNNHLLTSHNATEYTNDNIGMLGYTKTVSSKDNRSNWEDPHYDNDYNNDYDSGSYSSDSDKETDDDDNQSLYKISMNRISSHLKYTYNKTYTTSTSSSRSHASFIMQLLSIVSPTILSSTAIHQLYPYPSSIYPYQFQDIGDDSITIVSNTMYSYRSYIHKIDVNSNENNRHTFNSSASETRTSEQPSISILSELSPLQQLYIKLETMYISLCKAFQSYCHQLIVQEKGWKLSQEQFNEQLHVFLFAIDISVHPEYLGYASIVYMEYCDKLETYLYTTISNQLHVSIHSLANILYHLSSDSTIDLTSQSHNSQIMQSSRHFTMNTSRLRSIFCHQSTSDTSHSSSITYGIDQKYQYCMLVLWYDLIIYYQLKCHVFSSFVHANQTIRVSTRKKIKASSMNNNSGSVSVSSVVVESWKCTLHECDLVDSVCRYILESLYTLITDIITTSNPKSDSLYTAIDKFCVTINTPNIPGINQSITQTTLTTDSMQTRIFSSIITLWSSISYYARCCPPLKVNSNNNSLLISDLTVSQFANKPWDIIQVILCQGKLSTSSTLIHQNTSYGSRQNGNNTGECNIECTDIPNLPSHMEIDKHRFESALNKFKYLYDCIFKEVNVDYISPFQSSTYLSNICHMTTLSIKGHLPVHDYTQNKSEYQEVIDKKYIIIQPTILSSSESSLHSLTKSENKSNFNTHYVASSKGVTLTKDYENNSLAMMNALWIIITLHTYSTYISYDWLHYTHKNTDTTSSTNSLLTNNIKISNWSLVHESMTNILQSYSFTYEDLTHPQFNIQILDKYIATLLQQCYYISQVVQLWEYPEKGFEILILVFDKIFSVFNMLQMHYSNAVMNTMDSFNSISNTTLKQKDGIYEYNLGIHSDQDIEANVILYNDVMTTLLSTLSDMNPITIKSCNSAYYSPHNTVSDKSPYESITCSINIFYDVIGLSTVQDISNTYEKKNKMKQSKKKVSTGYSAYYEYYCNNLSPHGDNFSSVRMKNTANTSEPSKINLLYRHIICIQEIAIIIQNFLSNTIIRDPSVLSPSGVTNQRFLTMLHLRMQDINVPTSTPNTMNNNSTPTTIQTNTLQKGISSIYTKNPCYMNGIGVSLIFKHIINSFGPSVLDSINYTTNEQGCILSVPMIQRVNTFSSNYLLKVLTSSMSSLSMKEQTCLIWFVTSYILSYSGTDHLPSSSTFGGRLQTTSKSCIDVNNSTLSRWIPLFECIESEIFNRYPHMNPTDPFIHSLILLSTHISVVLLSYIQTLLFHQESSVNNIDINLTVIPTSAAADVSSESRIILSIDILNIYIRLYRILYTIMMILLEGPAYTHISYRTVALKLFTYLIQSHYHISKFIYSNLSHFSPISSDAVQLYFQYEKDILLYFQKIDVKISYPSSTSIHIMKSIYTEYLFWNILQNVVMKMISVDTDNVFGLTFLHTSSYVQSTISNETSKRQISSKEKVVQWWKLVYDSIHTTYKRLSHSFSPDSSNSRYNEYNEYDSYNMYRNYDKLHIYQQDIYSSTQIPITILHTFSTIGYLMNMVLQRQLYENQLNTITTPTTLSRSYSSPSSSSADTQVVTMIRTLFTLIDTIIRKSNKSHTVLNPVLKALVYIPILRHVLTQYNHIHKHTTTDMPHSNVKSSINVTMEMWHGWMILKSFLSDIHYTWMTLLLTCQLHPSLQYILEFNYFHTYYIQLCHILTKLDIPSHTGLQISYIRPLVYGINKIKFNTTLIKKDKTLYQIFRLYFQCINGSSPMNTTMSSNADVFDSGLSVTIFELLQKTLLLIQTYQIDIQRYTGTNTTKIQTTLQRFYTDIYTMMISTLLVSSSNLTLDKSRQIFTSIFQVVIKSNCQSILRLISTAVTATSSTNSVIDKSSRSLYSTHNKELLSYISTIPTIYTLICQLSPAFTHSTTTDYLSVILETSITCYKYIFQTKLSYTYIPNTTRSYGNMPSSSIHTIPYHMIYSIIISLGLAPLVTSSDLSTSKIKDFSTNFLNFFHVLSSKYRLPEILNTTAYNSMKYTYHLMMKENFNLGNTDIYSEKIPVNITNSTDNNTTCINPLQVSISSTTNTDSSMNKIYRLKEFREFILCYDHIWNVIGTIITNRNSVYPFILNYRIYTMIHTVYSLHVSKQYLRDHVHVYNSVPIIHESADMNQITDERVTTSHMNQITDERVTTSHMNHITDERVTTSHMNQITDERVTTSHMNHITAERVTTSHMNHITDERVTTSHMNQITDERVTTSHMNHITDERVTTSHMNHITDERVTTSHMNHITDERVTTSHMNQITDERVTTTHMNLDDVTIGAIVNVNNTALIHDIISETTATATATSNTSTSTSTTANTNTSTDTITSMISIYNDLSDNELIIIYYMTIILCLRMIRYLSGESMSMIDTSIHMYDQIKIADIGTNYIRYTLELLYLLCKSQLFTASFSHDSMKTLYPEHVRDTNMNTLREYIRSILFHTCVLINNKHFSATLQSHVQSDSLSDDGIYEYMLIVSQQTNIFLSSLPVCINYFRQPLHSMNSTYNTQEIQLCHRCIRCVESIIYKELNTQYDMYTQRLQNDKFSIIASYTQRQLELNTDAKKRSYICQQIGDNYISIRAISRKVLENLHFFPSMS